MRGQAVLHMRPGSMTSLTRPIRSLSRKTPAIRRGPRSTCQTDSTTHGWGSSPEMARQTTFPARLIAASRTPRTAPSRASTAPASRRRIRHRTPNSFCNQGARFGNHSSAELFYPPYYGRLAIMTWFTGGLRVFDIRNPDDPRPIAYFIPEPNDTGCGPQGGPSPGPGCTFANTGRDGHTVKRNPHQQR